MKADALLSHLDRWVTRRSRTSARQLSRRHFLTRLGKLMVGAALVPVLPVARKAQAEMNLTEIGDPKSCDYWRYCAIDGYLCSCCGGSESQCPPGTEPSPVTWVAPALILLTENATSFPTMTVVARVTVVAVSVTVTRVTCRPTIHLRTTTSTGASAQKPTPITARRLWSWVSTRADAQADFHSPAGS